MSTIEKLKIDEKIPIIRNLIENSDPEIKPNIITLYTISKFLIYHIWNQLFYLINIF